MTTRWDGRATGRVHGTGSGDQSRTASRLHVDEDRTVRITDSDGSPALDLEAAIGELARIGTQGDDGFRTGELDAADLAEILETMRRLHCAAAAVEARAQEAIERAVRAEHPADDDATSSRSAQREVSMASRLSPARAAGLVASSRRLVHAMPRTLTALAAGALSPEQAHAVGRSVGPIPSDEQRGQVDALLAERLPDLEHAGCRRLEREVGALVHAMDPAGASTRHDRARRDRTVTMTPRAHGMAAVTAVLPAIDASLMRKRLSLEAERLRAQGDQRGHQAIMADVLADAVIGRGPGLDPVTLDIGVIITERSLFAPDHGDAAVLEGYGTVPPRLIHRELACWLHEPADGESEVLGADGPALRAVLRRLYTHPTSGELVAVESVGRAFPKALARFVRWRDGDVCAAPYCDAPVRQTDHIRAVSEGGCTTLDNGQGLCAGCNAKERLFADVQVVADGDGAHAVQWTSRTGRTATVAPPPADPAVLRRRRRVVHDPADHDPVDHDPSDHDPAVTATRAAKDATGNGAQTPPGASSETLSTPRQPGPGAGAVGRSSQLPASTPPSRTGPDPDAERRRWPGRINPTGSAVELALLRVVTERLRQ